MKRFIEKSPLLMAIGLTVVDITWVLLINIYTDPHGSYVWIEFWNKVHAPIQSFLDSYVFNMIATNSPSTNITDMLVYEGVCVLQSTVLGYVLGILIRRIMMKKNEIY
jgi:hypothetical protein